MPENEVVFDSSSGIPIEEQKEILTKINGIAEKRRRHLSQSADESEGVKAKNNSALFPVLVNAAALLILCAGAWFIFFFNGKKDVQVRQGSGVYDLTEKALIDEIRKDSAMSELEQLSKEQDKVAAIDAQLAGGLTAISELIKDGKYDQAAKSIENFRYINNAGVFPSSRSAQSKREFYNKAIDSMETMITHLRATGGTESLELISKNSQLEAKMADMQKTIDSFSSGSSGQARLIKEKDDSISKLQKASDDKDKTIASLEAEKNNLTQTVSDLKTVADEKDKKLAELQSVVDAVRQVTKE
jgi:CHASE3 domain sensor protein